MHTAAFRGRSSKVSRPGEFRPQPLIEPYVTVSRHTAPIARPVADALVERLFPELLTTMVF
jgi:hypothetical protein